MPETHLYLEVGVCICISQTQIAPEHFAVQGVEENHWVSRESSRLVCAEDIPAAYQISRNDVLHLCLHTDIGCKGSAAGHLDCWPIIASANHPLKEMPMWNMARTKKWRMTCTWLPGSGQHPVFVWLCSSCASGWLPWPGLHWWSWASSGAESDFHRKTQSRCPTPWPWSFHYLEISHSLSLVTERNRQPGWADSNSASLAEIGEVSDNEWMHEWMTCLDQNEWNSGYLLRGHWMWWLTAPAFKQKELLKRSLSHTDVSYNFALLGCILSIIHITIPARCTQVRYFFGMHQERLKRISGPAHRWEAAFEHKPQKKQNHYLIWFVAEGIALYHCVALTNFFEWMTTMKEIKRYTTLRIARSKEFVARPGRRLAAAPAE